MDRIVPPVVPNRAKVSNVRGFGVYADFIDSYGAKVRVSQSSAASDDYIWIFIDGGTVNENEGSSHLNVEQARVIRDALSDWLKDVEEQPVVDND